MKRFIFLIEMLVIAVSLFSYGTKDVTVVDSKNFAKIEPLASGNKTAFIGGGCFWCVEAVFENVEGIVQAVSGYAGGDYPDPDYRSVSAGVTGHAEVVYLEYDPSIISYSEILDMFWKSHDPTTLNRQGADVGTQYRSIILYQTEEEKRTAVDSIDALNSSGKFNDPVVTELVKLDTFYPAEEYHQDYYKKNPNAGYCQVVIKPKLEKLGFE